MVCFRLFLGCVLLHISRGGSWSICSLVASGLGSLFYLFLLLLLMASKLQRFNGRSQLLCVYYEMRRIEEFEFIVFGRWIFSSCRYKSFKILSILGFGGFVHLEMQRRTKSFDS